MSRRGFSLAELAVALVLFSITGLGAVSLLAVAASRARVADHGERRLWEAVRVADSVATGRLTGAGERTLPDGSRLSWRVGTAGEVVVREPGSDSIWLRLPAPVEPLEPVHGGSRE